MTARYYEILTKEKLQKLYLERGLTIKQVCEELGVSQRTVDKFMELHGIERRPQGTRKESIEAAAKKAAKMRRMHNSGKSMIAIANEFGVTRQRVHQILKSS